MNKNFTVAIIGGISPKVLFESGRVIQRAIGAGYTDVDLYTSDISASSIDIIKQQLRGINSVFSTASIGDTTLPSGGNIISTMADINKDDIFQYDKLLSELTFGEFLLIITEDIDNAVPELLSDIISKYINGKRKIYIVDINNSQWFSPPSYHGALLKHGNRSVAIIKQSAALKDYGQATSERELKNVMSGMFSRTIAAHGEAK